MNTPLAVFRVSVDSSWMIKAGWQLTTASRHCLVPTAAAFHTSRKRNAYTTGLCLHGLPRALNNDAQPHVNLRHKTRWAFTVCSMLDGTTGLKTAQFGVNVLRSMRFVNRKGPFALYAPIRTYPHGYASILSVSSIKADTRVTRRVSQHISTALRTECERAFRLRAFSTEVPRNESNRATTAKGNHWLLETAGIQSQTNGRNKQALSGHITKR